MDKGSEIAGKIDEYNKRNKADIELRKCLKCLNFNKTVYRCKLKECVKK
jgi:hypothetical protein